MIVLCADDLNYPIKMQSDYYRCFLTHTHTHRCRVVDWIRREDPTFAVCKKLISLAQTTHTKCETIKIINKLNPNANRSSYNHIWQSRLCEILF